MSEAGFSLDEFDFRLPGVTSISCDTHKVGLELLGFYLRLVNAHLPLKLRSWCLVSWPSGWNATDFPVFRCIKTLAFVTALIPIKIFLVETSNSFLYFHIFIMAWSFLSKDSLSPDLIDFVNCISVWIRSKGVISYNVFQKWASQAPILSCSWLVWWYLCIADVCRQVQEIVFTRKRRRW